jgi:hypothetical protein
LLETTAATKSLRVPASGDGIPDHGVAGKLQKPRTSRRGWRNTLIGNQFLAIAATFGGISASVGRRWNKHNEST